jgi:hypothetical protein
VSNDDDPQGDAKHRAAAAEEAALAERMKAEENAGEVARLKSRGVRARVFGGAS